MFCLQHVVMLEQQRRRQQKMLQALLLQPAPRLPQTLAMHCALRSLIKALILQSR